MSRTTSLHRTVVIGDFALGSHRAHAINVVKTAGGFARLGHEVTLLCRGPEAAPTPDASKRGRRGREDARAVLAAYEESSLTVLFAPEFEGDDDARARHLGEWAARVVPDLSPDLIYARHFHGALACLPLGVPTVMETHAHVGDARPILDEAFAATRRGDHPLSISTISPVLRDHYVARGANPERTHIVPDGVDLELFSPVGRRPPGPLEGAGPHALYAGHLYDSKGVPTILEAARSAPRIRWHLVGGTPEDIEKTRSRAAGLTNLTIHGHQQHASVPPFLWHADVLLLPPGASDPSADWTSPVKLGEYLAAGPPIVATLIRGLRTWVDAPAVRWCRPDDAADLVRAVVEAATESFADSLARRAAALALARRFSYANRAAALAHAADMSATDVPLSAHAA